MALGTSNELSRSPASPSRRFDFRGDAGAEAYGLPYRWRPLTWQLNGKTYTNERSVRAYKGNGVAPPREDALKT